MENPNSVSQLTYGSNKSRRKVWKCHGRTSGNGCENDVINEDELFEKVASEAGVRWDGVENMKAEDFVAIREIMVYADGRVTVE